MKKAKKSLLLVLCALLLVVGSVMGTMAYLTSKTETITNTFSIGNVAITMVETKVDAYGDPVLTDGERTTTAAGQTYKLMPGHEYIKDPTITVTAGSEPCWLFVKVVNDIVAFEADGATDTIAEQLAANGWTAVAGATGVYWHEVVNASEEAKTVPVFGTVTIADNANEVDGWASIDANTTVAVTAYAVQADGFATAEAAWTAANFS